MNIRKFCKENGLGSEWRVRFKSLDSLNAWAMTSFEDKKIYLDPIILRFHVFDIQQILLHEICHTLCDPTEYHGRKWQKLAKEKGVKSAYMRYDWSKITIIDKKNRDETKPIAMFYMNYEDAKYCCENDTRCLELARDHIYLYDHSLMYRIKDDGIFTRNKTKNLITNKYFH